MGVLTVYPAMTVALPHGTELVIGPSLRVEVVCRKFMTVKPAPDRTAMAVSNKIISMSDDCKTPDRRHIYRNSDRCIVCRQQQSATGQASRVLLITISGEDSERELVDRLAEIVEVQVRGIFSAVVLSEDRSRVNPTPKLAELEVFAS